jgi:rubrerythrin
MKDMLKECKNLSYADTTVKIMSALNPESSAQVAALAQELCTPTQAEPDLSEQEEAVSGDKKYVCKICGYVYEGQSLPDHYVCPLCKRGAEDFEEMH